MLQYIVSLSVLILAVILVRALFRKKVPPMIIYAMWLVVVVRMCIPTTLLSVDIPDFMRDDAAEVATGAIETEEPEPVVDPDLPHVSVPDGSWGASDGTGESSTTAPYIPPVQSTEPDTDGYQGTVDEEGTGVVPPQSGTDEIPPHSGTVVDVPPEETPVTDIPSGDGKELDIERLALFVWIAGSVVMTVISVVSSVIFVLRARKDRERIHTVRGTNVYVSENVGTPCLAGLIPSIYLTPENAYSDACALTIIHEYTHLRHGDFIWSIVRQIALIVHWWNPLVWVAAVLSKQDAELACDAAITKKLNSKKRLEYARIIVDTVPQRRGHAIGLGNGQIKERILMITGVQKNRVIAIVLAVLICIGAVGCAFIGLKDEHEFSEGIYVRGTNGADVVVLESGICVMTADGDLSFADFTDGDTIRIEHGAIAESYPMQTTVYSAEKLADGVRDDIPADMIETLTALGLIEAEVFADVTAEQLAEAYAEAERIYAMFTGYGKVEYGEETVEHSGVQYQRVTSEGFTTYAELEESVHAYFADSLADELLNTKVGENPLYIEHEGELYRFSGYAALWGYDIASERSFEPLGEDDGEYRARVTATATEDGLKCTASEDISYTVDENGNVRFTEFTLMADSLFALYQRGEGVRVYVTVTFPDSQVGWFKVAQYGYGFYTQPSSGAYRIYAGNIDAVGYVVFGTKVTRWDEGFSEYITYRVEAKNGGIVSCEIADNIIDLDFAAVGTPLAELPDGVYRSMTNHRDGQAIWYSAMIEGDNIIIYPYPDGSEGGGKYYGTYSYDGASGKFVADLMYQAYYTNDPATEWGTIEARIFEYGDFVAVICDRYFNGEPMDMPIIYMKHEAIYGTERGVYFTSDPESFSPPESQAQKMRYKVGDFSYLISYYSSESKPCVYYGYGVDAERFAMVKTVFEEPDFEYTAWDITEVTVREDENIAYAYVDYKKTSGEVVSATYELDLSIDTAEPNEHDGYDAPVWKLVVPEEAAVYYTPTPTKYFPPKVIRRNENITLDETSYLITYTDSETLPCIYYAFEVGEENFAMVKTVFEATDFEYKSCTYSGVTVYDDSSAAVMYLTYVSADGEVLKLKYKLEFNERLTKLNILGSYNAPVWQIAEEVELMEEIHDIADWDSLPWISSAGNDEIHMTPIYKLVYSLVCGESTITEFNGLGIKDYTIKIVEDHEYGDSTVNFTFTVEGDSLPESIPQGEHSWNIEVFNDIEYESTYGTPSVYKVEDPEAKIDSEIDYEEYRRISKALDKFGDNAAVLTVDAWLKYEWYNWELRDYGKWGEYSYVPAKYILKRYGEGEYSIEYDRLVRLMAEKFGITDPEAMGIYEGEWDDSIEFQIAMQKTGCLYDKESGIVSFVAGTEMRRPVYRFLDVREVEGVTYVTVQLYADFNYLIPSYKVEYAIGDGDIFLGCEIVEGSRHKPNVVRDYSLYVTPVEEESATAYNTDDPTAFFPPESSHGIGKQSKIGDTYVRSYSVDDGLCVYVAKELQDGTFDMIKTKFEEPDFEHEYSSFRGYFDMGDGETAGAVVRYTHSDGSYTEVLYTLSLTVGRNPVDPTGYITPVWKITDDYDFDSELYASRIPNERARVESWARFAKSNVYIYLCSVRDEAGEMTKDFALYCTNLSLTGQLEAILLTLPEDLEYDTVLPVFAQTNDTDMGCRIYLKLTNGDEWYYVYFDNFDGLADGKFLEFKYKGVMDDRFEQNMWYNYHEKFELESQYITITDIADWDTLPWRDGYSGTPRAAGAYSLVYSMVSEDSTIPELRGLGVENYSLRLLYDLSGQSQLEFKFTVTGNSLPETLPPGDYTWTLDQGMRIYIYDGLIENSMEAYDAYEEKQRWLDKYGSISEVRALDTFLSWNGSTEWEVCDYGEWGDDLRPVSYISAYYGDLNLEISFTEAARLLEEKFGIILERPESSCYLDHCDYDRETDTVKYADTRGVYAAHRFLDVRNTDGVTYITVQFYADINYIIPSRKVEYMIGEGDVFLGCRLLDMGSYDPLMFDYFYTYYEAEVLPSEPNL